MKRVGFDVSSINSSWLGGVNYMRNLVDAVLSMPEPTIQFVFFAGTRSPIEGLSRGRAIPVVRSRLLNKYGPWWTARKLLKWLISRDLMFEILLKRHRIDVLSHSGDLGKRAKIPTICWIPDFQHQLLPEFFSGRERSIRNRYYRRLCQNCTRMIVSSRSVKQDLEKFSPTCITKSTVLHFAVKPLHNIESIPWERVEADFGIRRPYFLVANQFWAHKNHKVIVDALQILKSQGKAVLVIATGSTLDYRQAASFSVFEQYMRSKEILGMFRILDAIQYETVVTLLSECAALINPSKSEGWSTPVEEGKSLGKPLILSNIPVHREQAEGSAMFFEPDDARMLAAHLWKVWRVASPRQETANSSIKVLAEQRYREFGLEYQKIVDDIVDSLKWTGSTSETSRIPRHPSSV